MLPRHPPDNDRQRLATTDVHCVRSLLLVTRNGVFFCVMVGFSLLSPTRL